MKKQREKCFRIIEHKEYNNTYYTIQHIVRFLFFFSIWVNYTRNYGNGSFIVKFDQYKNAELCMNQLLAVCNEKRLKKAYKNISIIVYKECTDK